MIRLCYQGIGSASVYVDVNTNSNALPQKFDSIDKACDFLLDSLKVNDDEIDEAIIQLHANHHTVATFTQEGKLLKTGFY